MDLPDRFVARMRVLLGAEADEFLNVLAQPAVAGLRVNTLKISAATFRAIAPWNLEPLPWRESGFVVGEEARPGQHPYHAAGLYYLQEPTAMAVAEALAPRAGELVLDLAAAPGGKSTHLLSLMCDDGVLVANEIEPRRTSALAQNLERWGARNVVITNEQPERLADQWGASFDRVLLDAPCSGEGMFRKSEAARAAWSEQHVHGCALRQARALDSAARLVRAGGWLAYSTCTFAPEENENVIARFLDSHHEFALTPIQLAGAERGRPEWVTANTRADLALTVRFFPHHVRGEGHFTALLRRVAGDAHEVEHAEWTPAPKRVQLLWQSFVRETFECDPARDAVLTLRGDQLFAAPSNAPSLDGLKMVCAGLWLGTARADRFEPSHSLALSLRSVEIGSKTMRLDFDPDDERLKRYLQGHPLDEAGANGWVLVSVSGFPLGWGRRAQGVLKNYYPKGLRR